MTLTDVRSPTPTIWTWGYGRGQIAVFAVILNAES